MKFPLPPSVTSLLLWPLVAHGTIVTTAMDEDDGSLDGGIGVSLREAVNYSPVGDTITFDAALSGQTIRLTLGELLIAQSLIIDGSALAARIALSGDKTGDGKTADDIPVMQIGGDNTVVLDTLDIVDGSGSNGAGIRIAGRISESTTVTIRRCHFSGNSALGGGAIYAEGNLNLENCTFTDNSARVGAAIFVGVRGITSLLCTIVTGNAAENEGGGIFSRGSLLLQSSSVVGNTATAGGGIYSQGTILLENSVVAGNTTIGSGGGIYNFGVLTLRNSTCSGNSAAPDGGGIYNYFGSLLLEGCTLAGNTAKGGGGGLYGDGGSVDLRNTTVSGNTANSFTGGGIAYQAGTMTLGNSIVAGNAALNAPLFPDISGTFTGSNNLTSGNPRLAPLSDYGGPTQTMPPLPGSPAINAGGTTTLTTDQRGFARVGTPDLGAVEYQEAADITRFWKLDFDGDGSPYGVEQALGTDPLVSDPANNSNLSLPSSRGRGHSLNFGFGIGAAVPGTRWIVRRSPDLSPGSFQEIYRFDGSADTIAPGYTYIRLFDRILIADDNPPAGGAFYRFEAVYEP